MFSFLDSAWGASMLLFSDPQSNIPLHALLKLRVLKADSGQYSPPDESGWTLGASKCGGSCQEGIT